MKIHSLNVNAVADAIVSTAINTPEAKGDLTSVIGQILAYIPEDQQEDLFYTLSELVDNPKLKKRLGKIFYE